MQKCYTAVLWTLAMVCLGSLSAQTIKKIEPSGDLANPTDIFPIIMGDTTATGERNDNNTIYQLENGATYLTSGRMVNTTDWILHIEAEDLNDTDNKAILTRKPNTSGTFPDIMRPEGDVTLKNVWIISGQTGALQQHDWGKIRISGANTRVIVKDCIIEKDRGGFLQIRADGVKCYVDNTIFRNGGNRGILQGNGRGIDGRNFYFDTLKITNTVVHNIQDRFFRSQGATQPHNYVEIDHCTSFNTVGRHGHIQLGRVLTAKITNNIFMNPIMLGTSPAFTDEQTQPDGDLHKVITLDTLYDDTDLTISNNNIFWTQDVLDYWGTVDSVSAVPVLSQLIKDHMGADTANAYFEEVLALDSIPVTILQYVKDLYADPTSTEMFDFIVEDILVAGTPFDSGNLFDLSEMSTCYPDGTQSAFGGTDGMAIGSVTGCAFAPNFIDRDLNTALDFRVGPNPIHDQAQFYFELPVSGPVNLQVFDLSGRAVATVMDQPQAVGTQRIRWNPSSTLSRGLYIARLETAAGIQTLKFSLR